MTALIRRARRHPYFWLGIGALFLVSLSLFAGLRGFAMRRIDGFTWQVSTGLLLFVVLAYQWVLLAVRQMGLQSRMRMHFVAHRWMGIVTIVCFLLHAQRAGYGWTLALTLVFFFTGLSGLFSKEIVGYKRRWTYLLWLWCHICLAFSLVPMIAVHIWIALTFQGAR
ncbi:hypothetical protein IV417_13950 [Alphaproteobacteria bacterium KMM 3653]|uniref:Uncharacterized protein n=1 Tax=Harenicola maris TaxID=2841044 RepID=A0AAP2CQ46_9RHOB|nr:hypothetical protein [Harenicola maris]